MNFVMGHEDVVGLIYHMNFPYPTDPFYSHNPTDNNGRRDYYSLFSVPRVYVDGAQSGTSDSALLDAYEARKAAPTAVSLEIQGDWDDQTRSVDLSVTASTAAPLTGDYRLYIALVENDIYYAGSNGLLYHEYTLRDMFPDFGGSPAVFAGDFPQTATATASFVLPTGDAPHEYVAANCQIVAFLQESDTREVQQAAAVHVTDLGETAAPILPARFALEANHPNPFNPRSTIPVSVKQAGSARMEILDARGRRVRILHDGPLSAGRAEFSWDGRDGAGRPLASGVYLARLTGATESHSRRLVLVK